MPHESHNHHESHDLLELITRHDERISQLYKSQKNFITKEEFEPVKRIVYTTISLIITGLLLSMLHLILKP